LETWARLLLCCWHLAINFVLALATLWAPLVQEWSLYKKKENVLRIGAEGEKTMVVWVKMQANYYKLCHGCPGFSDLF